MKTTEKGQYEISYQPTSQGRQQLHIKVEGDHIKGSPFPVSVIKKFVIPNKTIGGVKTPQQVAVNQRGEVIVAVMGRHCVTVFSPTGGKIKSFGSYGMGNGQFNEPYGIAVDGDGNILVADEGNHRIQKFTSDGKFITAVDKKEKKYLKFSTPLGITINPINNKVYITDHGNHRIQILNPDLTFSSTFGRRGVSSGHFEYPWDVVCDRARKV